MKLRTLSSLCFTLAILILLPLSSHAQRAVTAYAGATDVTFSNTLTSALSALGVKVGHVNPTMLSGSTATLPLVSGAIDLDTGAGSLVHSGGITFENGSTTVRLQSLLIDTAARPSVISAVLIVDNAVWGRYNIFDITLPSGTTYPLKVTGNTLTLKGVKLTLHSSLSAMLNKVYGVSQFTPGFDVGTADLTVNVSSSDWTY